MDLERIPLFSNLGQDELDGVRKKARERVYPKGATVFVRGQDADGLYIICSGRVKVLMLNPDGREKTLAILRAGETLGEVTLYGSDLRSATVETLDTTTFLFISREDFQSLLLDIPPLALRIIEILSGRLRRANRQIEELSFLNARSRVICAIMCLAEEHGCKAGQETQILFPLTHAELAKLVGVTRETVSKVLSELQEKQLIRVSHGRIGILNAVDLQRQVL